MFERLIDDVPGDLDVQTGGRPTISIALAASRDGNQIVFVEVRLWPHYWSGVECHEFKFAIVVWDRRDNEPVVLFDRNMAAGYLGDARGLVLPCVLAAGAELVRQVQPEVIYRATYKTWPPEKALCKHQLITDMLQDAGYSTAQCAADQNGRHYWIMVPQGEM